MTCIQTITCVLTLSILAASALGDTREHNDVHIRDPNEASGDLIREFQTKGGEQISILCKPCEWVVKTTRKKLGDDSKKEKIRDVLNRLCDKSPFGKSTCKKVVGKFMDKLENEILTDDDPHTACVNLKLCKSKPEEMP